MRIHICTYLILVITTVPVSAENKTTYMKRRDAFMVKDNQLRYGNKVHLSHPEMILDRRMLSLKKAEIKSGIVSSVFPARTNFMAAKPNIERSQLFKMVQRMPKGGVLHGHFTAMIDPSWLIAHATYRSDCYMCLTDKGGVRFHISRNTPNTTFCTGWRKVNDLRRESSSPQEFDRQLRLNLTILTPDPDEAYPTLNAVWKKADTTWPALADLVFFKDILPQYFTAVMTQYLQDGVQYFETRCPLYTYDYDRAYDDESTVLILRQTLQRFIALNPKFIGVKLISEMSKLSSKEVVGQAVRDAVRLHQKYPDMVAGFDLVAQEAPTHPILYYLDELLQPSQMSPPYKLPYFFHAGETTWEGTHIDDNLMDALLLNTSRVGHGYAAVKHPEVLNQLKQRDVPIEVNPISNQVLLLVEDLRNHPCAYLLAHNFSIVVASDDPGLWGALPLSHDMYELLISCVPMDQALRVMKRLAVDSIKYSAMSDAEKSAAYHKWMGAWNEFVSLELLRNEHIATQQQNQVRRDRDPYQYISSSTTL